MNNVKKRKGKKMIWTVLAYIAIGIAVILLAAIIFTAPGRSELKNMSFENVDFDSLSDGTYIGEYKGTKDQFRNVKIQVNVASGEVVEVKVLEGALANEKQSVEIRNGQSIDDLFTQAIQAQSMQVDAISGATLTSNAHLKALENALKQAEK